MKLPTQNLRQLSGLLVPWLVLAIVLLIVSGFIAYSLYQEHGRIVKWEWEQSLTLRTIRPATASISKPHVLAVGRYISALYTEWHRDVFVCGLFGAFALSMALGLYLYQSRQLAFQQLTIQYEAELRHNAERLKLAEEGEQTFRFKSKFLATVAHEFRTPLSLLISSADILDRYGERLDAAKRTEQNGHIRSAARQMSSLIDSVLSFNRLETGKHPNYSILLDVERACRAIAEEVTTVWGTGHEYHLTINADCGTAILDEILFRRVLENLLTNAFRYTPAGRSVSLNVSRESSRVLMVIMDNGIGIPKEDQKLIFDEFYRGRNVETRRGLGLGLTIVHEALLRMGGTITLTSLINEGTTMRVEIPIVDVSIS